MASLIGQMAVWDAYKLTQLTPDGFQIQKRTNPASAVDQRARRTTVAGRGVRGGCFRWIVDRPEEFLAALADGIGDRRGGARRGGSDGVAVVARWAGDGHAPLRCRRSRTRSFLEDVQPGFSSGYGVARPAN